MSISKRVMNRVVHYEKQQVAHWVAVTFVSIVLLFVMLFILTFVFIQKISSYGSLDLLALFWEDPEIIKDFWLDTLQVFWVEMPKFEFFSTILLLIIFFTWIQLSKNKRNIIRKKMSQLARYSK